MQFCDDQANRKTTSHFVKILLQVIITFLCVMPITVLESLSQYISNLKRLTQVSRFKRMLPPCNTLSFFNFRQAKHSLAMLFVAMFVAACGDVSFEGGDGLPETGQLTTNTNSVDDGETPVLGAGVKGPLTDANVTAYVIDITRADLKGEIVAVGTTDELAQLQMDIDNQHLDKAPFLLEYQGGFELNGSVPVIDRLLTVITEDQIRSAKPVYATPLTSVAVNLANHSLSESGTVDDLMLGLELAEERIKEAFGMDDLVELDLFETPPVLVRSEDVDQTFALRRANELLAATVEVIRTELVSDGLPQQADVIVQLLSEDLADDYMDGMNGSLVISELSSIDDLGSVLTTDPGSLLIPGTDSAIDELDALLLEEAGLLQRVISEDTLDDLSIAAAEGANKVLFTNDFVESAGEGNDGASDSSDSVSSDSSDSGSSDSGSSDSGSTDSGSTDSGSTDSGSTDSGSSDSGSSDTGSSTPELTVQFRSDSVNLELPVGDDQIYYADVNEAAVGLVNCEFEVKSNGEKVGNTVLEQYAPYEFSLSRAGTVPEGDYMLDVSCFFKDDASVSAAATTSLTVVTRVGDSGSDGSDSGSTDTGDSGTGDSGTGDSGTGGTDTTLTDLVFSWVWPTTREDGSVLTTSEVGGFELYYYQVGQSGVTISVDAMTANDELVTSHIIQDLPAGDYEFAVAAVDTSGRVSEFTTPVSFTVN